MMTFQDEAKAKAAKLEKADILELAVKHVQYLHDKFKINKNCKENTSDTAKEDRLSSIHGKSSAEELRER